MGGSAQLGAGQNRQNGGVDPSSGSTQAGQGYGNATSNNFDTNNLQSIGSAVGGSPTSNQVLGNMAYLQGPDKANYQIQGMGQYQNQLQDFRDRNTALYNQAAVNPLVTQGQDQQMQSYNALQQMAQGQGPSLARANLQAGLNQQNAALQSQAMSSAGGAGAGNSQRNLLNAQAAAGTNMQNQASQASVAEQMGALQQQGAAANALRNSAMAQQGINFQRDQSYLGNQMNSYNAGFGANLAQTQANMGYDQSMQNVGRDKANVGLQATNSGAQATRDAFGFFGNLLNGGASAIAGSDENMKTDIADDDGTDSDILGFLRSFTKQDKAQSAKAPAYNIQVPQQASSGLSGGGIMPKGGFVSQDNASNGLNNFVKGNSGANQNPQSGLNVMTKPIGGKWDDKAGDAGTTDGKSGGGGSDKGGGVGGMLGGLLGGGKGGESGGSGGGASAIGEILPQVFSMLGSVMSDERGKKNVRSSDRDNNEFMGKLESKSFRYKDPDQSYTAKGRVHGVMAQDMEKSKVGRGMVMDTPVGKLFNMPKAVSATLSSLATLNKRMDKFEKKAG